MSAPILEVIVTSLEEAIEAEAGGADRLELCRALDQEGLTPSLETVRSVVSAISIPVRAMVRPRHSMSVAGCAELDAIVEAAANFAHAGVNGIVAGYLQNGAVDVDAMRRIAEAAANVGITFHRAVDEIADPADALRDLRNIGGVDRVLTHAAAGAWPERVESLRRWRREAGPDLKILFAIGAEAERIGELRAEMPDIEVHVGRAAREPQTLAGAVSRVRIARLKQAL